MKRTIYVLVLGGLMLSSHGDRYLGHAGKIQFLPEKFGSMNKKAYLCT